MNNPTEERSITTTQLRPEDDTQELWALSGRVDAAHDYLMNLAKNNAHEYAKNRYITNPIHDPDMFNLCIILGFHDVLAVPMEERPEEAGDD